MISIYAVFLESVPPRLNTIVKDCSAQAPDCRNLVIVFKSCRSTGEPAASGGLR
jgi:hypothetical protein